MTADVLRSALQEFLSGKAEKKGRMTYKQLQDKSPSKLDSIEVSDGNIKDFLDTARKYDIDYGYKNKTEYIRDCVRARGDITPDRSEIAECNRLMKRIGSNINQILIRLHSTGHIYAEDISEIKKGVNEIWHTLLSIQSRQQTWRHSAILQTEIRPSTVYMSSLMLAEPTAEVQPPTSEPSEPMEQDGHKSSHTR